MGARACERGKDEGVSVDTWDARGRRTGKRCVSSSSVRRRRGIGACAVGVLENGVALGVVRQDEVYADLIIVKIVVWQRHGLVDRCARLEWYLAMAVRRAQVGAGALGTWLITAGSATTGAAAIGAAILAGEFHRHCCKVVGNAMACEEILESFIFLGDGVTFFGRGSEHFFEA